MTRKKGRRRRKRSGKLKKSINISKPFKKQTVGFKFFFSFLMLFMAMIFMTIYAFTPISNIPILQMFVASNYAYKTPIMLINELFPVILILSSLISIIFVFYVIQKFWN